MSTLDILLALAARPDLPDDARAMARLSLFDWMVCGLAGVDEPVAQALRACLGGEGGTPVATLMGGPRLPARAAAMVNGATSHALDYDDTHFAHVGHLSAGICPAALAAGEQVGASAAAVADAFLVGAEAAIRVGLHLGRAHYDRGFHQTATAGAFGATVAAARLYGLTPAQLRAAIGLCATRASGLKGQFGTMGKPLNAGIAAANGVECAGFARAGLTSADDGLEGPQGFIPTHADAPDPAAALSDRFLFTDIRYKLHACCHGTHAMIEALRPVAPARIAALELRTAPRWLSVCDIKRPRTGLEVKFSYAWLAAMVLSGIPTASDRSYTDARAADPLLAAIARRVTVTGDPSLTDMQVAGEVRLADGSRRAICHDLAAPIAHDRLAESLRAKGEALIGPRADLLWQAVSRLESLSARDLGRLLGAA
ncbi:MAG: MmgE/PrpD family protein [Rhodobacter sp.]|nr:MmgE/PrpD family protein [Rhodobacter sp.]